jgi:serine phosphatase RsbU (regulator of sigma subunit)
MSTIIGGKALIVDEKKTSRVLLKTLLTDLGFESNEAGNGREAVDLFKTEQPDIIFMGTQMPEMDGYEATRQIKAASQDRFTPVIFITDQIDKSVSNQCIEAGGDDLLTRPFDQFILQIKIKSMQRIASLNREVQGMVSMLHREQEIAESFYINAIQSTNIENQFIKSKIRPAGTFSGDMVLSAYSPSRELLFLIGDFTGHGLSAALGAMPVSEVFRAMAAKGFGPADILSGINKKLKSLLPVGMFFGVQLVIVNQDLEHVRIFNAGMPDLLIVDGQDNSIKHNIKSTGLPLGILDDIDAEELVQYAPIKPNDKVLMFSDGLTEARNVNDEEFGEDRLQQAIINSPKNCIFEKIYHDLDKFCGDTTQIDDVTLVEITCVHDVLPEVKVAELIPIQRHNFNDNGEWEFSLKFSWDRLRKTNPVPMVVNYLTEIEALEDERQSLFTVMTELYVNALDHGVLGLDSSLKIDPSGFARYFEEREKRLLALDSGHVIFNLSVDQNTGVRSILLRIEDSGGGFDYMNQKSVSPDQTSFSGRGILLIENLCESLEYRGRGNIVEAVYSWNV